MPFAVVQFGGQQQLLAPPSAHDQHQLTILEQQGDIVLGLLLAARRQIEHAIRIERAELEAQLKVALPEVTLGQLQLRVAIELVAELEGIRFVGVAADL